MVSGAHWYIKQNVRLPWYEKDNSLEIEFLMDTGASDPMITQRDLRDLGIIKKNCPHVASRRISTAVGVVDHDFYPLFINHLDPVTEDPLYPPMDTIVGVLHSNGERLSGLDLWRFCYVASEPSTGVLTYHTKLNQMRLRSQISPGGTMTPRAWYTRVWDQNMECFRQSTTHCILTQRPPRLLNPEGERWVFDRDYDYQVGNHDRTPHHYVGYIPGHKVHPPTPGDIRDDRKYYWRNNWPYRDNRRRVNPTDWPRTKRPLVRDEYYQYQKRPMPRPLNPWQYKVPEESNYEPTGHEWEQPRNPLGTRYWDEDFEEQIVGQGLSRTVVPTWRPGERKRPRKYPATEGYWGMRNPKKVIDPLLACPVRSSTSTRAMRPRYLDTGSDEEGVKERARKRRKQEEEEEGNEEVEKEGEGKNLPSCTASSASPFLEV